MRGPFENASRAQARSISRPFSRRPRTSGHSLLLFLPNRKLYVSKIDGVSGVYL